MDDVATAEPVDRRPPPPPQQDALRSLMRLLGELMVTAGAVLLLFVVYELYVTDLLSDRAQDSLTQDLRDDWGAAPVVAAPPAPVGDVPVGEAFAFLHVPRLGENYERAVVEGTSQAELAQGPGHYV